MMHLASGCDGYATSWSLMAVHISGTGHKHNDVKMMFFWFQHHADSLADVKVSRKPAIFIFRAEVRCKFMVVVMVIFSELWSQVHSMGMPIFQMTIMSPSSQLKIETEYFYRVS
jgi:hypothetical protein